MIEDSTCCRNDVEFPLPSINRSGWPWTLGSRPLQSTMRDGNPWPKISIVTPSYNQGQYIEETIRSVLLQNYPNFEYIIMDGGSSDNSVDIIRKYSPWLTYWTSKEDDGQVDAIQRGFDRSTGEIMCWINSDDYYHADAFYKVSEYFIRHGHVSFLIGGSDHLDQNGTLLKRYYGFPQNFYSLLYSGMHFSQPACFWRKSSYELVHGLDVTYSCAFDYDFFLKLRKTSITGYITEPIVAFRVHSEAKSIRASDLMTSETSQIRHKYAEYCDHGAEYVKRLQGSHRHIQLHHMRGNLLDHLRKILGCMM